MIKIDLITGFLGAGKTTFLKLYVKSLLEQGIKVGIIENDFGAVNVDMMLLQDLESEHCEIEMINASGDKYCHTRRLKTKLIAMKMRGIERVVIEPSGIYDTDEFFDLLHEEPLENWYEVGNVFVIVDSLLPQNLSKQSRYLLASQIVNAGKIILSKVQDASLQAIKETICYINDSLQMFHATRKNDDDFLKISWQELTQDDMIAIQNSGYHQGKIEKLWFDFQEIFQTVYLMNKSIKKEHIEEIVLKIFDDQKCGYIYRIKGFVKDQNQWYELNAMKNHIDIKKIAAGQDILIVIGENLEKSYIENYF